MPSSDNLVGLTLDLCWINIVHSFGQSKHYIWTTLAQLLCASKANDGSLYTYSVRHPMLAQRNWLHWTNVGPTIVCLQGHRWVSLHLQSWINVGMLFGYIYSRMTIYVNLRGKSNFLNVFLFLFFFSIFFFAHFGDLFVMQL